MANISPKAFRQALKSSLPSGTPQYKVEKLARELGVPKSTSVRKDVAIAALKRAKEKGDLSFSMHGTSTEGFGRLLDKAAAPTGPSAAVKKMNISVIRKQMDDDAKKKADISAALAKKPGAPGASKPSASRAQAPVVGGGVIGKAAQGATQPESGRAGGSLSSAGSIERAETPPKPEPPSQKKPEEPYDGYPE